MKMELNRKLHTFVSVLITIVVVTVMAAFIIQPALNVRHTLTEKIADLQFQYSRFYSTVIHNRNIDSEIAELKKEDDQETGFLQKKSMALLAADLQQRLSDAVADAGSSLVSTQVIDREEQEVFQPVTITVNILSNSDGLQKIIDHFHTTDPVLLFDNVLIKSRRFNSNTREQDDLQPTLDIRFDLTGFLDKNESQL